MNLKTAVGHKRHKIHKRKELVSTKKMLTSRVNSF